MAWRLKKLAITPRSARLYLFFAACLILFPTIMTKLFPSHEGRFLIATNVLDDVNFSQTVLYMTGHDGFHAKGFVINREAKPEKLESMKSRFPFAAHYYWGGPVQEDVFFLLAADEGRNITIYNADDLMEDDMSQYNALISDPAKASRLIVLHGYAGWRPMQLNKEIFYGGWGTIDYDPAILFDTDIEARWRTALAILSRQQNDTKDDL